MKDTNRSYIGMRQFVIAVSLIFMTVVFFIYRDTECDTSLPGKLERMMNAAEMDVYRDGFYGYAVRYPSFFEQVPDKNKKGGCKFRYGTMRQIIQTASVALNLDSLTVRQGMNCFAAECHATEWHCGSDYFILSGPLYVDGKSIKGYRFHAKYVKRQKLWFVQCLTYPEDYAQAVTRLIKLIDGWQVWEDDGSNQF